MRSIGVFALGLATMTNDPSYRTDADEAWCHVATNVCEDVGLRAGYKMDAGETAAFVRQLEFIKEKTYDVRYPNLRMQEWVPLDTSVPTGAQYFTWRAYDSAGYAKLIANYSYDLPSVKLIGGEVKVDIQSIGIAYDYTIQDVRAAAFSGSGLDVKRPQAARRFIENALDMIAATGVAAAGLPGFFTNPNVPILSAPGSLNGNWLNPATTPQQILDDMNALANFVVTNSKTVHAPDSMLLPVTHYSLIASKVFNPLNGDTILAVFLKNSPYIKRVNQTLYLNNAANGGGVSMTPNGPPSAPAGGGVGGVARFMVYTKDPEMVGNVLPQLFEQFPPESRGLEFSIACHARTAGVTFYYPLSAAYGDGI